jgi:hypothetical protein
VQTWEVRSETVYSTGNYGSSIDTEVLYAPLEIRRIFEWGEIGVAIPYLWYRSEGTFSYLDTTGGSRLQTIPISGSAEGIYDLLFDATYRVVSQSGNQPEILLHGYWKPPTGNEDAGLGSGSHDWILGAEFWGWIPESQSWFYFGDVYRYFSGGAPGRKVNDSWIYEIGIGGVITPDLVAKVSYREQTALAPGIPSAQSVDLETEFKVNPSLKILSGVSLGMSDAAPDLSVMMGFECSF